MHAYHPAKNILDRAIRRRDSQIVDLEPAKCALVVIDMQNYFVSDTFPSAVPMARGIIPNINAAADALRDAGGKVIWVRTTATGARTHWGRHHRYGLKPDNAERRLAGLADGSEGHRFHSELRLDPRDPIVEKIKFSAFAENSSGLDELLKQAGIEAVFVAGTLTNVCCDSTARDAMMRDYRAFMLSDANAALSDEEHAGALNTFHTTFGPVLKTTEAIALWRGDH